MIAPPTTASPLSGPPLAIEGCRAQERKNKQAQKYSKLIRDTKLRSALVGLQLLARLRQFTAQGIGAGHKQA